MKTIENEKIHQVADAITTLKLNLYGVTTEELKDYSKLMQNNAMGYDSTAVLNRGYSVERSKFLHKVAETTERLYKLRKSMDESEAASKECKDAEAAHDALSKLFIF